MRCLLMFCVGMVAVSFAGEPARDRQLVPLPQKSPSPESNPTTAAKVELGKKLFFDPRLSGNNMMSCATCHVPDQAYTDGKPLSPGKDGKLLDRNTPSCLNVGFFSVLFWDGRSSDLEQQALEPIRAPAEMDQDLDQLERELSAVPGYVREFQATFDSPPNRQGIAQALAAFQRSLVTGPSPFDRYLQGENDALSQEAKTGLELFRGEAGCIECHHGPLLSDGKFHRLGVSPHDLGRANITGKKADRYRFRTPSLRNIAETGPYMHDGSMSTLSDVVTFYYRGIPDQIRDGLTPDTTALEGQSFSEIGPLVEFLRSLTGTLPEITPPTLP